MDSVELLKVTITEATTAGGAELTVTTALADLPAELVASLHATEFLGYERLDKDGCKIVALIKDGKPVHGK